MKNQMAKDIFQEYREKTDSELDAFNRLKTAFPFNSFAPLAAQGWRDGMLAVMWGTIATQLSGGRVKYLENWRVGK